MQQQVTVRTATGTSEARLIRCLGSEVLVEVTRPAPGIVLGERLVVPVQRVTPAAETGGRE